MELVELVEQVLFQVQEYQYLVQVVVVAEDFNKVELLVDLVEDLEDVIVQTELEHLVKVIEVVLAEEMVELVVVELVK
jgi:hypothetical protein